MDSAVWRVTYINRLIMAGLMPEFAAETYEAGIPHDEEVDPEDAADEEMGYQEDDE